MKAVILDTETTGLKDPRRLIEVAYMEIMPFEQRHFQTVEAFFQRYNPEKEIELGALATHHIMDEDLVGCPSYTEFKLPDDVDYIIGHNIDFDWDVIGKPPVKRICTLALARSIYPALDSHSQSALMYKFYRDEARATLKTAHSAGQDIIICKRILEKLLVEILDGGFSMGWEELWQLSERARVPTVMPYGKHKGVAIKDVPADYKRWLLKQADVDPYLVKALSA